ncbi:MAG TPA: PHP domain-containing protein [Dehalococcoidales bacterium]|nr:PHP domain-containing protein [Dehalococcoidales bacterium]
MLKADFHIHTKFSMDCHNELEEISRRCQQLGLNCIAVCDHDATEGAMRLKEMAPFKVIVAEEVLTPAGEVMGIFLKERIASGLSVERAIDAIRAQGGLVCIPHPFDGFRGLRISYDEFERIVPNVDIIEVFNARCRLESFNKHAREFAEKHHLAGSAGSDAHSIAEIGNVIVEMPDFDTPEGFLKSLQLGKISGKRSSPMVHFHSTWAKIKRAF